MYNIESLGTRKNHKENRQNRQKNNFLLDLDISKLNLNPETTQAFLHVLVEYNYTEVKSR